MKENTSVDDSNIVDAVDDDSDDDDDKDDDVVSHGDDNPRGVGAANGASTEKPPVVPRRSTRVKKKPVWYDSYIVGQQTVDKFIELNLQNTKLMTEMFKSLDK